MPRGPPRGREPVEVADSALPRRCLLAGMNAAGLSPRPRNARKIVRMLRAALVSRFHVVEQFGQTLTAWIRSLRTLSFRTFHPITLSILRLHALHFWLVLHSPTATNVTLSRASTLLLSFL